MDSFGASVLLVGTNEASLSFLRQQLQKRGYRCWFASSPNECGTLCAQHDFHLVLSAIPLDREGSIIDDLGEATRAVFYCYPVKDSCWWLPVMREGQRCFGAPGLRPHQLAGLLDQMLKEIQSTNSIAPMTAQSFA